MEEIKVGEYVRTISGNIDKVDALYGMIKNTVHLEKHKWQDTKNIVNHSPNIIDLIEVGDYVNGKLVKHIADFEGVKEPIRKLIFVDEHRLVPGETAENDEIKSICTKEQFKSIEYIIEED